VPAIVTIMLVVVCEPDLLQCQPVFHWARTWPSVESCRRDRPGVSETMSARVGPAKAVMTTCRLFVDEGFRLQRVLDPRRKPVS